MKLVSKSELTGAAYLVHTVFVFYTCIFLCCLKVQKSQYVTITLSFLLIKHFIHIIVFYTMTNCGQGAKCLCLGVPEGLNSALVAS